VLPEQLLDLSVLFEPAQPNQRQKKQVKEEVWCMMSS